MYNLVGNFELPGSYKKWLECEGKGHENHPKMEFKGTDCDRYFDVFFSSWTLEISIIEWSPLLNVKDKAGEMPQQLRILATLLYDLSSTPSTAMVALSYL